MPCCGSRVESARINGKVLSPPGDDEFAGPTAKRSCRDIIFLIFFIVFIIGWIIYLAYAGNKADPQRLIHGSDNHGNVCGRKNDPIDKVPKSGKDFSDKKYLYMGSGVTIGTDLTTATVDNTCVKSCPTNESTQIGFRCLPIKLDTNTANNKTNEVSKAILGATPQEIAGDVRKDLMNSWREIIYISLIGLAFALIITALLRFLAQVVVWVTVVVIGVSCIAATIYMWVKYHLLTQEVQKMKDDTSGTYSDYEIEITQKKEKTFLVGAIIVTIFAVLTLILLIAMRKRIKLVIALFKEAGKAITSMPLLLLQPIWTCIWLIVIAILFVFGLILINSSGEPKRIGETIVFVVSNFIQGMRFYHIFGFFWVTEFIVHCQHLTIAGAVAKWYFTRDKSRLGWPILTSMKRLYLYHLGSIALGSMIIAIMKMIRYLLKKFEKRLGGSNPVCGFLLKCCQCCLWCFEKFLKFLSRNAYIEIAIYGCNFCKGAQKAFAVIVNNAFRIMAINYIGSFVLLLSKIAVVVPTVFIGIEIMKSRPEVVHIWVPILLAAIFTFGIAHCFISVYEMTIDTLFVCFCEDCEKNDGIQKPYFMSKGLMKLVENSKQALEALENNKKQQQKQQTWATNVQPNNVYGIPVAQPPPQQAPGYIHGGMTPLHPPYPANSIPPSPSHLLAPPRR